MSVVKFTISAEAGKFLAEAVKVISAQGRMEAGFNRMAAAGTRGMSSMARGVMQTSRAIEMSGSQFRQGFRVRDPRLALTPMGRAALMAGDLAPGGYAAANRDALLGVATARSARAQQIRSVRAADQFHAARLTYLGTRSRVQAMDREAAQRKQALQDEIDFNTFAGRMDKQRQAKEKFLQRRQQAAAGALAVGAAVAGVVNAAELGLEQYASAIVQAEDTMAPLFGVGDNMNRRTQIRQELLSASIGRGVDISKIAQARFNLESAAADLPPDVRDAMLAGGMRYHKLQGADIAQTATALNAAYQLIGDVVGQGPQGVKAIENKLAHSADVGAFEIDQFTPYQAMILAAFKGMGYTPDDAYAASAVASRSGMRPESWSTAVRNLPLVMSAAKKKGIEMPEGADFGTTMAAVAKLESPEMLELVGRDPFVVAKLLSDNLPLLKKTTDELKALNGEMDLLGAKLGKAWSDPMHRTAEVVKSAQQLHANAPALKAQYPWLQEAVSEWEITKAGAELTTSPLMSWFKKPAAWIEYMDPVGNQDGPSGDMFRAGLAQMTSDATTAGDTTKAGYLSLRYGKASGTYYKDQEGNKVFAGEKEAEDFIRRRSAGETLTAAQYIEELEGKRRPSTRPAGAVQQDQVAEMQLRAAELMLEAAKKFGADDRSGFHSTNAGDTHR